MLKIFNLYLIVGVFMQHWLMPILVFISRVWMARIFWHSGLVKISNWDATIYLFEHEYKTPWLPPEFAAYAATTIELICPILLLFGFATRFATLPMLAMVWVIHLVYPDEVNLYWAILLGMILFYGPGYLSIDALLKKAVTANFR